MRRILTVTLNPALDLSTETARVSANVKLRCAEPRADPGGGGVNVSRAIRQLGGRSDALIAAGGPTGARLVELLKMEGLAPSPLPVGAETRISLSVSDLEDRAQYRFVMPGPLWSARDLSAAAERVAQSARTGDLVIVSGSLPPGAPPDWPLALARRLRAARAHVLLDTSGAPLTAAAAARDGALAVLRMDDEEAEALHGGLLSDAAATADFAARLVAEGAVGVTAVARGAEGSVVADATGRWLCAPPKVAVVSAVGAGDSFVAAFAMALAEGRPTPEACAAGVAAAAAAVTTPGTRLCERETFDTLLPQVVVTAV
jgi:6-phosphofructokinase 2